MKYLVCFALLLWFISGCTKETTPPDEDRLEQIRFMLDSTKCMNRIEELAFLIIDGALADSSFAGGLPPGIPDSLLSCPVTQAAYSCSVTTSRCMIECPSGHAVLDEEY
jgi:hypothetical protein